MRTALPVALALSLVAIQVGHAQSATVAANTSAVAPATSDASAWTIRSAGRYRVVADFHGTPQVAHLVLRDSSGTLAGVLTDDSPRPMPLAVHVSGKDLVLFLAGPEGVMTLTLARQGDSLTGTWERGGERGGLTGAVAAPEKH